MRVGPACAGRCHVSAFTRCAPSTPAAPMRRGNKAVAAAPAPLPRRVLRSRFGAEWRRRVAWLVALAALVAGVVYLEVRHARGRSRAASQRTRHVTRPAPCAADESASAGASEPKRGQGVGGAQLVGDAARAAGPSRSRLKPRHAPYALRCRSCTRWAWTRCAKGTRTTTRWRRTARCRKSSKTTS